MIDKITARIKRYPFQTGIIVGVIACLLIVGFFSLFQDHGRTLAGNSEIIQQDYLRMAINEFSQNHEESLALWRYDHLGRKAGETLKLMRADDTISVYDLVNFANAVGQTDKIGTPLTTGGQPGSPTNPKKGLSGFGKALLIILGLGVAAAGGLYVVSLIQTRKKQQRRAQTVHTIEDEPVNIITAEEPQKATETARDTLFDLDSLFTQNNGTNANDDVQPELQNAEEIRETELPENKDVEQSEEPDETGNENSDDSSAETEENEINLVDTLIRPENPDIKDDSDLLPPVYENTEEQEDNSGSVIGVSDDEIIGADLITDSEKPEQKKNLPYLDNVEYEYTEETGNPEQNDAEGQPAGPVDAETENSDQYVSDKETDNDFAASEERNDAEKPLVETDPGIELEGEDELLKMIRDSQKKSNDIIEKTVTAVVSDLENAEENQTGPDQPEEMSAEEENSKIPADEELPDEDENNTESVNDILIHYQSSYRIGNDMYDEVFSIDQGDVFRGECGISIGETMNNTEPKAVTAFEVWLFDKDDIHTATWYLMSDFAYENESISNRLEQRGQCDRIRKGDLYRLETETLCVEIKVLELEYGNEMEEKNSYFTNVVFDVIAKSKQPVM